jgi:hypothetical protein
VPIKLRNDFARAESGDVGLRSEFGHGPIT